MILSRHFRIPTALDFDKLAAPRWPKRSPNIGASIFCLSRVVRLMTDICFYRCQER